MDTSPAILDIQRDVEELRATNSLADSAREILSLSDEDISKTIDSLATLRLDLVEQLELERMVEPPIRSRDHVLRPEDRLSSRLELAIYAIDAVLHDLELLREERRKRLLDES